MNAEELLPDGEHRSMSERRHLEIVATLGPASWESAAALRSAGANVLRLNASHMAADELGRRAAAIRGELPDTPLVVDLQGAKMRLSHVADLPVRSGEHIIFSYLGGEGTVRVPHREIFGSVAVGETLSCDDDRLRFRVEWAGEETIGTVCLNNGSLRPRKGINVLEHPVRLGSLSGFDLACIQAASGLGPVAFAYSFMNDGSEALWLRRQAPECPVIGKIERREATANFDAIARVVDSIWVCRGDLGAQLGLAAMARWIAGCNPRTEPCRVFMAGQVLEHLTSHSEPTRSEVCHLFDLVSRGYSGFVLSDETAVGEDPVRAVAALRFLLDSFR